METVPSAANSDPTLYCEFFHGPLDGLQNGDMPTALAGHQLTGLMAKLPLTTPHQFSLFAVYICVSETQMNGFWRFEYVGLEGPSGEPLEATVAEPASANPSKAPSIDRFEQAMIDEFEQTCAGYGAPADTDSASDETRESAHEN